MSVYEDVRTFHLKFGLPAELHAPRALTQEESDFRIKFMQEELDEYVEAVVAGNLEKQFDALLDLIYVAAGTALFHGFNFPEGWARVQAANMAKERAERAEDSKRGTTFDVIKPPGWVAPDLSDLVKP